MGGILKRQFVFAAALLAATSAQADTACKQTLLASLPMTISANGGVVVPVAVDGQALMFGVDPTLIRSQILRSAADKLGLARLPGNPETYFFNRWRGQPDTALSGFVQAGELRAGTLQLVKPLLQAVPATWFAKDVSGAIGSDFLDKVDADFDFGHARLNLFSMDHCPNQVIYWTKDPAAMIPFLFDNERRPTIMVALDGQPVRASLDASTSRSYSSFVTAGRLFGLTVESPGLTKDAADGTYLAKFNTISLEGVTVNHPEVALWPGGGIESTGPEADLGIGMAVLSKLHVYSDQSDREIFITGATAH